MFTQSHTTLKHFTPHTTKLSSDGVGVQEKDQEDNISTIKHLPA
jgi:hypothetical protein